MCCCSWGVFFLFLSFFFLSFLVACTCHRICKMHATECLSVCALGRKRELEISPLSLQSSRSAQSVPLEHHYLASYLVPVRAQS